MGKSIIKYSLLGISVFSLMACSSMQRQSDSLGQPQVEVNAELSKYKSEFGEIPIEVNRSVLKWVSYYKGRGARHMRRYLQRSTKYMPLMKKILRQEGLPEDLIYLLFVESGFSSSAHSFAGAVGYWQFIRATGKFYGLKVGAYVDERRDPELSTIAASKYLKSLYNLFGDWYLAMAAYNTGENRVKRAVMRGHTRDFWKLVKKRRIPRETRNYVPKFIAAAMIGKDPEKYGFKNIDYEKPLSYEKVYVKKPISLIKLAKQMGVSHRELKKLNPIYRSEYVPIYRGSQSLIKVPKGYTQVAMNSVVNSYASGPLKKLTTHFYYKVRRGDSLSTIAHRYRTRVSTLRRVNNLRRRSYLRIGQRLRIPERGVRYVASKKSKKRKYSRSKSRKVSNGTYYKVRRGDNLSTIARRHRVSLSKLRKWNRLNRRSLIKVGQKLRVKAPYNKSRRFHTVRRGETLTHIARRYKVTLNELVKENALRSKSRIYAGAVIYIPGN